MEWYLFALWEGMVGGAVGMYGEGAEEGLEGVRIFGGGCFVVMMKVKSYAWKWKFEA